MQTTTWMPPAPRSRRPGWPQVLGWYVAGAAATVAVWSFAAVVAAATSPQLGLLAAAVSMTAGIVVLSTRGRHLAQRSVVALVLGIVTPFVLAALAVAALAWAFAHSNLTF
jgi:hypothetical protein